MIDIGTIVKSNAPEYRASYVVLDRGIVVGHIGNRNLVEWHRWDANSECWENLFATPFTYLDRDLIIIAQYRSFVLI